MIPFIRESQSCETRFDVRFPFVIVFAPISSRLDEEEEEAPAAAMAFLISTSLTLILRRFDARSVSTLLLWFLRPLIVFSGSGDLSLSRSPDLDPFLEFALCVFEVPECLLELDLEARSITIIDLSSKSNIDPPSPSPSPPSPSTSSSSSSS